MSSLLGRNILGLERILGLKTMSAGKVFLSCALFIV